VSDDRLDQVCRRLAAEGIDVTVVERDGVLYANVHATSWSEPHTWLRVFMVFAAVSYWRADPLAG